MPPELYRKIREIIAYFETSSISGYDKVSLYKDGKDGQFQVTYGLFQTTQDSWLPQLLTTYCRAKGEYSEKLKAFVPFSNKKLSENEYFLTLLRLAGNDPVMQQVQNSLFEKRYFAPAFHWAETYGFKSPLSYLVIADSFVHSGKIRQDIRNMFPESPPSEGGSEKLWIKQYCESRRKWLLSRKLKDLHRTIYRPDCFLDCINNNNWDLTKPINANGKIFR